MALKLSGAVNTNRSVWVRSDLFMLTAPDGANAVVLKRPVSGLVFAVP